MEKPKKPKKPKTGKDKEHKDGEWRERKASYQEKWATPADVRTFLDGAALLRYNVISQCVETTELDDQLRSTGRWIPLDDRRENTLYQEMYALKPVQQSMMHAVINSEYVPEYNPFEFYLSRLPRWNQRDDFLMELSLSVNVKGDADEQILFYQCLKKWLVGMVAGWLNPEVVNHQILVFIGQQGAYKTTWFNYLLPPELRRYFYTKTNATRMDKDDRLKLTQYGLVCCEELDTMSGRELNQLKAAVTMPAVDERPAFHHYVEHRHHIASFCGTGNNAQFLSDTTGNRRWLPFEVENIVSPREQPFNYEGIYKQAYWLYQNGFQYWFSANELERLSRHNQGYETPKTEEELVLLFFRKPYSHEADAFMPVGRALQILSGYSSVKLSVVKLGQAFRKLGFEQKRCAAANGYKAIVRPMAEVEQFQKQLGTVEGGGTFP